MSREASETGHHGRLPTPHVGLWRGAAEVAKRQHGVVSLSQLVELGFTAAGVVSLCQRGRLHRIHRGVYALSPAALSREGNWMAAVLAGGPGSLLASRSAGAHHGLITNSSSLIDVMTSRRVRRPGLRAHRMKNLGPRDRAVHLEIPCTSVARTLLDIAAFGLPGELQRALEKADEIGVFDLFALQDVLDRNQGARGSRRLLAALPALAEDDGFRSEFERRFLPISRSAGMPEPLINHTIQLPDGPIEVDFYWPELRLVVELDGFRFHGQRRNFREDRRRDRRLGTHGIHCLRYVWEDLDDRPRIELELRQIRLQREASETGHHSRFLPSR